MNSHEELSVCLVSMCWVRMQRTPPSALHLIRLLRRSGFEICENISSRCIRASVGLNRLYSRCNPTMAKDPKSASHLLANVWLTTCDSAPSESIFADWLQIFFPSLDQIALANESSWICKSIHETFQWWFPLYSGPQRLQRTIIIRRSHESQGKRSRGHSAAISR